MSVGTTVGPTGTSRIGGDGRFHVHRALARLTAGSSVSVTSSGTAVYAAGPDADGK